MATYFNPGNNSFRQDINSKIYVDKTGLITVLNGWLGTADKCVSLSHARRFGKSQAAGMIGAYYSKGCDSTELFAPFDAAKDSNYKEHLNKYNVIHLDVSSFADQHKEDLVDVIWQNIYREMKAEYPEILDSSYPVATVLSDVFQKSGVQLVIIIDEWDCPIRNHSDKPELVHKYLQFLHSMFKSEESKSFLALAYITGILPIKRIEDESALNNFVEFSMLDSDVLTEFFGFTENEVIALCEKFGMQFDTIKEWYDGYLIDGKHMYNPSSVYRAMVSGKMGSYWKNTSAFSAINRLITLNYDGLKEDILTLLDNGKVRVDVTSFKNDFNDINCKDDALTALIHLGYLGFDANRSQAYMPNYEVRVAYQQALKTGNWKEIAFFRI